MEKSLDFKDKLILIYFNNLKEHYNPVDIILLLKINYENFYERLIFLINNGYLFEGEFVLEISEKGRNLLVMEFLNNIEIQSILERGHMEDKGKDLKTNEILYFPKDFRNKI
jgi:hypothetical protein